MNSSSLMEESTDEALSLHRFSQSDGISQTPPSKATSQCQRLSVTLTTVIGGLILKFSVVFDSMNLESGDWVEQKSSSDSKAAGTQTSWASSILWKLWRREQEKRKAEESKRKDERKSQDGVEEIRGDDWMKGGTTRIINGTEMNRNKWQPLPPVSPLANMQTHIRHQLKSFYRH